MRTLLAATLALAAGCAQSESNALVDRVIAAYGGAEAVAEKVAVKQVGRIRSPHHEGGDGSVIRGFEGPDRLRVEIVFPEEPPEVRVLNGRQAWRQSAEATGPSLDAIVLQAARLALPGILLERRGDVVDKGTVEREGQKLRVLQLPLGRGLELTVEIDPATGYIVRSIGRGPDEGSGPIEFTSTYADHRQVGRRVYAFREANTAMGQPTGEIMLLNVEFAESFPPQTFLRPGAN